jgi:hypothetical protein
MRISLNDAIKKQEAREARANGQTTEFKNLNNFFLKDKEKSIIQLLVSDPSEIPVVRSHLVSLYSKQGKQYYVEVSCLGEDCPFCHAKSQDPDNQLSAVSFAHDRLIIPLVVLERGGKKELTYALFTRSINFYTNSLSVYGSRFDLTKPIEISRSGQGTSTTYNLFPPLNPEEYETGKTLDELKADLGFSEDDAVGRVDSIVKTWTAEQMDFYLNTKQNPTKANMSAQKEESAPQQVTRRTARHNF